MHPREKLVEHERLEQIVVRSEEQPGDAIKGLFAFPGDEDDADRVPVIITEAAAELIAGDIRQVDVEEDHIRGLALDQIERLSRIGRPASEVALLCECARHEIADDWVAVYDEHSTARSHVRCHTDRAHAARNRPSSVQRRTRNKY